MDGTNYFRFEAPKHRDTPTRQLRRATALVMAVALIATAVALTCHLLALPMISAQPDDMEELLLVGQFG